jgi:hypothetical protein
MARKQDWLPEAERFIPFDEKMSLLIFGDTGEENIPLFQEATDTPPGSKERVEIYRARAGRREPIFNPNDDNSPISGDLLRSKSKKIDPIKEILRRLENRGQ